MARDTDHVRPISVNRRARRRFHVLATLECGIELKGTEVKSLRAGHCSLDEAYGLIKRGELYLMGATIPEYSHGNIHNHKTDRPRKLLAHRRELYQWEKKVKERGMTLAPMQVYFKGHLVKVEMALVQGKKLFDKREDQKSRDAKREMDRALKRRRQ